MFLALKTVFFLLFVQVAIVISYNADAKRLFDDLMVNYNRQRRPARTPSESVTIKLKLRLSQIIDVHEIDQIMTCSVWLKQIWMDRKLAWDPKHYGGVNVLYVPYEMIWVPDLVLYNNADLSYNITISTKATLHYSGQVTWEPPAIFKSFCQIDVQWFPFDEQLCNLKIGSWTFSKELLNLEILDGEEVDETFVNEQGKLENATLVEEGIDLSDYYPSVEWDIMERRARRRAQVYPSCCPNGDAYVNIMYFLVLRRKPLFYTVNLIFPCVGISFLTVLVFYLPADSGEKVSLAVNILVTLTWFFLLLMELIPATSIVLPLISKYLLFTTVMVTVSVVVTVVCLNLHWRTPTTHSMPRWIKNVFLQFLPKVLFMQRPLSANGESFRQLTPGKVPKIAMHCHEYRASHNLVRAPSNNAIDERMQKLYYSPPVIHAFNNICFIAALLKKKDRHDKVDEDWKYVAMVLDRFFLIVFTITCLLSAAWILLQAPTLFDGRKPIDLQHRPMNISSMPWLASVDDDP
uniref:Acetylcholine receptor subunit alpha-type unc-38 n=1 Tax=Panagrellus redivivus TaxID=6233 RepID=A0A7E4VZW9_PANRE